MPIDHYYTLGRSGLRVSRLALGTMTFGTGYGWDTDRDASLAIFDRYVDAGGNFLDTAEGYHDGASEEWLGEFVRLRGLRDRMEVVQGYRAVLRQAISNPHDGPHRGRERKVSMI